MATAALESWLRDHRAAHPQLEPAWVFLSADPRRDACGAFEALKQEWLDAAYAIRAPNVAATKLQWWAEELQRAHSGQPRHPLTQAVFADACAREIPLPDWHRVVHAALSQLETPPPADFPSQLEQAATLHGAIARAETALWFGSGASAQRAEKLAAVQRAVAALRNLPMEVDYGRTPLPMSLLARHGLSQTALIQDSPARRAALRDQAGELLRAIEEAARLPGPLGPFRGLQARLDRRALRAAGSAADPLQALCRGQGGVRNLLDAWSEAKAWHRATQP